jgi:putative exporter of polyketide antibiotics
MTTSAPALPAHQTPDLMRRTAFLGGALYVLTFVSSIPAAFLTRPALDPTYVVGAGVDDQIVLAGVLDIVNLLAAIGTAVVLYPVVKRQNRTLALGFVATRLLEASVLFTAVLTTLAVVTLRQQSTGAAGADPQALVAVAGGLIAVHDWAFLLGPGVAVANAFMLAPLMLRSGLVPRLIPLLGLVGAPLLLAANLLTMFGFNEQLSLISAIALPGIFFWELSLGVYLMVKGFRPVPILTSPAVSGAPAVVVTR